MRTQEKMYTYLYRLVHSWVRKYDGIAQPRSAWRLAMQAACNAMHGCIWHENCLDRKLPASVGDGKQAVDCRPAGPEGPPSPTPPRKKEN
eukprot:SAG22_NODE_1700_length_3778_cov_13.973362_2_plen_90_part_00